MIAHCTLFLSAETVLRGLVKLQSSGSKPLVGVEISAFGANPAYTNNQGQFELVFPNKRAGDAVTLVIQKQGFELINTREISKVVLRNDSNDPVTIVMSKAGERDQQALSYYNIFSQRITSSFAEDLNRIQEQLDKTQDDQEKRKTLQAEIDLLKEERYKLLNQVENLARELAKVDLDQASELTNQVLRQVENGNIRAALNLLSEEALEKQWLKIRNQEMKLAFAKKQAIEAYLVKANLQLGMGKPQKAFTTYLKAHQKDSTHYTLNIRIGKFLSQRHQSQKAIAYFRKAFANATFLDEKAEALGYIATEYRYLGDYKKAADYQAQAIQFYQQAFEEEPIDFYQIELARLKINSSLLFRDQAKFPQAQAQLEEAIRLLLTIREKEGSYAKVFLINAYQKKASILKELRQYEPAAAALDLALTTAQHGQTSDTTSYLIALADIYNDKGLLEMDQMQLETAEASLLRAATLYVSVSANDKVRYLDKIRQVKNNLGVLYNKSGKHLDSYSFLGQTLTLTRQLFELNPARFRKFYASTLLNIGVVAFDLQQLKEAEDYLKEAIAIYRQLCLLHPGVYEVDLNQGLSNLAILYTRLEKLQEAILLFQEAQQLLEQQISKRPGLYEFDLALLRLNLAGPYAGLEQIEKALVVSQQALETILQKYDEDPAIYGETLAKVSLNIGLLYYEDQRYVPAKQHLEQAEAQFATLVKGQAPFYQELLGNIKDILTLIYLFVEDLAKAEQKNMEALELLPDNPLVRAHKGHVQLYQGNWEAAKKSYLKNAPSIHAEKHKKVATILEEELLAFKAKKVKHPLLPKAIRLMQKQN